MVPQHLAVIGGEHDQGVVVAAGVLQKCHEPTDLGVDLAHHPVVGGTELAQITVTDVKVTLFGVPSESEACAPLVVQIIVEIGVLFGLIGRSGSTHGQRYIGRIVLGMIRLGRNERWVRGEVRQVHEPGLVLAQRKIFDDFVGEKSGGAVRSGESGRRESHATRSGIGEGGLGPEHLGWSDLVAPGLQLRNPRQVGLLHHVIHHPDDGQHARQHTLIGARCGVVGLVLAGIDTDIGIAEKRRLVSGFAGFKGHVCVPRIERCTVYH